jgi:hypothetical protein
MEERGEIKQEKEEEWSRKQEERGEIKGKFNYSYYSEINA